MHHYCRLVHRHKGRKQNGINLHQLVIWFVSHRRKLYSRLLLMQVAYLRMFNFVLYAYIIDLIDALQNCVSREVCCYWRSLLTSECLRYILDWKIGYDCRVSIPIFSFSSESAVQGKHLQWLSLRGFALVLSIISSIGLLLFCIRWVTALTLTFGCHRSIARPWADPLDTARWVSTESRQGSVWNSSGLLQIASRVLMCLHCYWI